MLAGLPGPALGAGTARSERFSGTQPETARQKLAGRRHGPIPIHFEMEHSVMPLAFEEEKRPRVFGARYCADSAQAGEADPRLERVARHNSG